MVSGGWEEWGGRRLNLPLEVGSCVQRIGLSSQSHIKFQRGTEEGSGPVLRYNDDTTKENKAIHSSSGSALFSTVFNDE